MAQPIPYRTSIIAVLFAICLAFSQAIQAQTDELRRARDLIQQGQPKAALEVLAPLRESQHSVAEYHYFTGLALLDSGDIDGAIVALRVAIKLKPDLLQARAELGRAHLLAGDYLAAHAVFQSVKDANPPPEVSAAIDRYIDQMFNTAQTQRPRFRGSMSAGIGHDSNVNSATSAQQIFLPILGGITAALDSAARARKDTFASLGAEVSAYTPLNAQTEVFGGAGANLKANSAAQEFDFLTGNLNAGLRHTFGEKEANQVSLSASFDAISQDHRRVRDSVGVNGEFRRIVHPLAEVSVYGQISTLNYPREGFRDADRKLLGVALIPAAFGKRLTYLPPVLAAYTGSEKPKASGLDHLGHDFTGLRTTAFYMLDSRIALLAGLSYEKRGYGAPDPLFQITRKDRQIDFSVGVFYSIDRSWSLAPSLIHTENQSSLEVFRYRRTAATLLARYAF